MPRYQLDLPFSMTDNDYLTQVSSQQMTILERGHVVFVHKPPEEGLSTN